DLAPTAGDPHRAQYLQWTVHFANTLMPAFRQWFYPQDFAPADVEAESKAAAAGRIEAAWDRVDRHLAANGPYLLGEKLSLADLYLTMLMRWSRNMPKSADCWPALAKLAGLVKQRPAWRELYRVEQLTDWI
ncbi:MAG: glutathione S-transferase family protein, partial [Dokdonella sp.]